MADPLPSHDLTKYYFCDDATLTVWYSKEFLEEPNLIYLGTSDNPKPKMAVAAFTHEGKIKEGYRIQEW
jgi:hypothetical protein